MRPHKVVVWTSRIPSSNIRPATPHYYHVPCLLGPPAAPSCTNSNVPGGHGGRLEKGRRPNHQRPHPTTSPQSHRELLASGRADSADRAGSASRLLALTATPTLKLIAVIVSARLDTLGVALALAGVSPRRRLFASFEAAMPLIGVALGARRWDASSVTTYNDAKHTGHRTGSKTRGRSGGIAFCGITPRQAAVASLLAGDVRSH